MAFFFSRRFLVASALFIAMLVLSGGLSGQFQAPDVVAVLKGHQDTVDAVAVSPDGSLIATGSFDQSIRLWDAKTGKEVRAYAGQQGHRGQVLSVAFSPKGDLLASGGADNSAKIWDVPAGVPGKTFALSNLATSVAVSGDGKTFAVASTDGVIKLFPQGEEKGALTLTGHVGSITGIGFTQNNQFLISAGTDRTIRFWSAKDGKEAGSYGLATADITGLAVNPNNQAVYTTSTDGVLRFWQVPPPNAPKEAPAAKDEITSLYVTPDGAAVLYASADKTATLVTVSNGNVVETYSGAKAAIAAIAMAPGQQDIAAGCADGSLIVWDKNGKEKAQLPAHRGGVSAVAFHPSQPILLTAGADGLAKGWILPIDTKKPKEKEKDKEKSKLTKFEIKAHTGKITAALFHPTNGQVITAGADKLVRIWDPAKPEKAVREIGPFAAAVSTLTISRDGQSLAGVVGKDVIVWNTADGKETAKISQDADVHALSFNADKTRLLLGRSDNIAVLVEVATGVVLQTFAHKGAVHGVFHHPNQPQVITASSDKALLVRPITATRAVVVGSGKPAGLTVTQGGDRIITAGPGKDAMSWNTGNGDKDKTFASGKEATAAAISKNGQIAAIGGSDGSIQVYTFGDGKLTGSIAAGAPVVDLAFHPSQPILVGVTNNKMVTAWNIAFNPGQPLPPEFGQTMQSYAHPVNVKSVAFNNEGLFFTAAEDKTARRFTIASDKPVKNLGHPNLVDCVAFDESGERLATGCHDGRLRIWDVAKGTVIKEVQAHVQTQPQNVQNPIYCVAWAPGGKQVLTTSFDRSMKLWDAASGNLVREFMAAPEPKPDEKKPEEKKGGEKKAEEKKTEVKKTESPKGPVGHRDQVFTAVFTKDGKYIASGSSDRSVKLWEVSSGKVVRDFPNPGLKAAFAGEPAPSHPGWVQTVRFTPDEKFIVSIGPAPRFRGYIAVWSVADGKQVYGVERDFGPHHGLALMPDGKKIILGCGPRQRIETVSDALILKLPAR